MTAMPDKAPRLQTQILGGIEDIIDQYDHFILDIWGVLHNGIQPFPHVIDCLATLKNADKQVLLLSNTPSTCDTIAGDLATMAITQNHYDHIITAGDSARRDLESRQGQKCWYAGLLHEESLVDGLDLEFLDAPEDADFMINAIYGDNPDADGCLTAQMKIAAAKGLDMICPNPDKVVQVGETLKLCPGTFAAQYETYMDGTVLYHGKPHDPIYSAAWDMMGAPDKSRMIAIGDSLHTDIQGANNFGIDSIFNLIGIHRDEFRAAYGMDLTLNDLHDYLSDSLHIPDLVIEGVKF